jgi:hypothetical protein
VSKQVAEMASGLSVVLGAIGVAILFLGSKQGLALLSSEGVDSFQVSICEVDVSGDFFSVSNGCNSFLAVLACLWMISYSRAAL